MDPTEGARSFLATGQAYDRFMGRYSRPLAVEFADAAGVPTRAPGEAASGASGGAPGGPPGDGSALDVGCGPGALTAVLADRLGAGSVSAFDPSPPFVAECAARNPGATVREGRAEAIPYQDARFDFALAQLVLHFVTDPLQVAREFRRVLRPGGVAAACVWDFSEGMQLLRLFWDAALALDLEAPDEARTLRFGRAGEIAELFTSAGLQDVTETTLEVRSSYSGFAELWSGFLAGIGPAGSYCVGLPDGHRAALEDELFRRLGSPSHGFELTATARCASARSPG